MVLEAKPALQGQTKIRKEVFELETDVLYILKKEIGSLGINEHY